LIQVLPRRFGRRLDATAAVGTARPAAAATGIAVGTDGGTGSFFCLLGILPPRWLTALSAFLNRLRRFAVFA